MYCSQCQGIENIFNRKKAESDLKEYRRKGPAATTRLLIEGLKAEGVEGLTLLDIGSGVGVLPNELLRVGAREATDVDASAAYLEVAKAEAAYQNHADRINYYHGDFLDIAADLSAADIVTLDRVICCYHDMDALVELSSARALKLYGLVLPRESWWLRLGLGLGNLFYRLQRNPFRVYMHPTQKVEAKVRRNGLNRRYIRQTLLWQVMVYAREPEL